MQTSLFQWHCRLSVAVGLSLLSSGAAQAQTVSAGAVLEERPLVALESTPKKPWQWRWPAQPPKHPWRQAMVAPLVLAGVGLASFQHESPLSQWDTQEEIREHAPRFHTHIDNYLIWVPYAGLSALLLAHVPARDAHTRTVMWVTAKAAITTGILVQTLKTVTARERPDGSARTSFPSGHTAQAFLGAALLDDEFRESAPWVGPAAYTVASGVGVLRMYNNRHWQSDVFAGAALGLAIGKISCLTQRRAAGGRTNRLTLVPTWLPRTGAGLCLTWQPGLCERL
jgi:PAP2 superfamily